MKKFFPDTWVIVKSVSIPSEGQTVEEKIFTYLPQFSSKVVLNRYASQMIVGVQQLEVGSAGCMMGKRT